MGKPGLGIGVVHFGRLKQRRDRRPGPATAVASGEETIFSRNCLGSDRSFNDVGVELDPAIGQETLEDVATRDGISKRFGKFRLSRNSRQGRFARE
ncbi:hypothetical protein J2W52_003110 [Rhizobium miluonense]|uniref:Uncharacterized protein n=1 Tax=Rhizobium miluonense TaxID=411945 RepID=A0ABU1SR79_9HYPH|nr:hypothetical protein [Rhizobium miluonense]